MPLVFQDVIMVYELHVRNNMPFKDIKEHKVFGRKDKKTEYTYTIIGSSKAK